MTEKYLQTEIFRDLGGRQDVRLFRNNVGTAWMGKAAVARKQTTVTMQPGDVLIRQGRRVRFGLHVGSGDLIGWRRLLITPSMVGQKIAQFLSIEVKTQNGRVTDEQENWLIAVNKSGGRAGVVRSVADAVRAVDGGV